MNDPNNIHVLTKNHKNSGHKNIKNMMHTLSNANLIANETANMVNKY